MKCGVCLDKLEKAAQAPEKTEVELQKDVVQRQWRTYTIHDAIWHVHDAWKVTESCIHWVWKKLCPELSVNFRGFDLFERLSECLKCFELARRVGLDKIEEEDYMPQSMQLGSHEKCLIPSDITAFKDHSIQNLILPRDITDLVKISQVKHFKSSQVLSMPCPDLTFV